MRRLLIASAASVDTGRICDKLVDYDIQFCSDGRVLLESMNDFDPDILFLDLQLPYADGVNLLRDIRLAGSIIPVIVTLGHDDVNSLTRLCHLKVSHIILKPWTIDGVLNALDLIEENGCIAPQVDVEEELDYTLIRLGFKVGLARYQCVRCGILERYKDDTISLTKELYQIVHNVVGGAGSIEKGIRDAIRAARIRGDPNVWKLYFPSIAPDKNPTN